MAELYDADGTLLEGALTPDEAKAVKEAADAAKKEAEEIKAKLQKLENKDMNFKKFRDLNEEERTKLSSKEIELMQRQDKLEEEQKTFVGMQVASYKDEALAVLAGDNDDLRKKTLFHFDRIKDEAVSKAEIQRKMRDAYRLAKDDSNINSDPFARAMAYSGEGQAPSNKGEKDLSNDVKELAKRLGLSEEDLKKHVK